MARRSNRTGVEENTLAIIESVESKDTQDANDDRMAFPEAVRAASFAPEIPVAPTSKMYERVFQILRGGKSLELMMSGYQLLHDSDKHFPQVYVSKSLSSESHELVVVDEAWSPFNLSSDVASHERLAGRENSSSLLDFSGFTLLIGELAEVANVKRVQATKTKYLKSMLLFQYLVSFLEGDFLPRNIMYEETMNWTILRESLLNMLLIMELDTSKKNAGIQGQTTRADGVRTPLLEIILDELTYNVGILSPFLQVFNQPKWKLEIIVQYFLKYTAKPSIHTRRSNGPADDATFNGLLNRFSNSTSAKKILKKIRIEIVQLLLAHGFQAHLSLSSQQIEGIIDSREEIGESSLVEICKNMICTFQSLRRTDEKMEILPIVKEALFTAATIISTNRWEFRIILVIHFKGYHITG